MKQQAADLADADSYNEQKSSTCETTNASNCPHDDSCPQSVKQEVFLYRLSTRQDSNVSRAKEKEKEAALKSHNGALSEPTLIHSRKREKLCNRSGACSGPSRLGSVPSHQNTDLGSKATAFHPSPSTLLILASKSPVRQQHCETERKRKAGRL